VVTAVAAMAAPLAGSIVALQSACWLCGCLAVAPDLTFCSDRAYESAGPALGCRAAGRSSADRHFSEHAAAFPRSTGTTWYRDGPAKRKAEPGACDEPLSSVSSVSPSLRTAGRNFSAQPASKTPLRPTYRAPCKLRAVFGRLGTLGKLGRLSSIGQIWDLPDLPKCSM
jgi:hypothetical protein